MRDEFNELWQEREELMSIEEKKDPFCICDEFGEDSCPIHTQVDLEIIPNEDIEKYTKNIKPTNKKTSKRSLGGMQKNHKN